MMKKWKRILVSALAVTTAAVSVSGMSAGAVAFYSTSLEPPKGYTELDDKSFLARATNYSDAYTVYTDGKAESFFMGGGRRRYDDGKIQNIYIPKDEAKMKLYTRADIAQPWEGLYWTTAVDGTQSNAFHFWYEKLTGTGGIAPAEAYARANGMQVRCVKVKNL